MAIGGAAGAEFHKDGSGVWHGWGLRFQSGGPLSHIPNVNDVVELELHDFCGKGWMDGWM
jgi:hypothetical protein